MSDNTCNGYANWSTWNVELWIDNEEPLYKAKWRLLRSSPITAKEVREFCLDNLGESTPDGADFNEVDWDELADMWNDERKEEGYANEEYEEEVLE